MLGEIRYSVPPLLMQQCWSCSLVGTLDERLRRRGVVFVRLDDVTYNTMGMQRTHSMTLTCSKYHKKATHVMPNSYATVDYHIYDFFRTLHGLVKADCTASPSSGVIDMSNISMAHCATSAPIPDSRTKLSSEKLNLERQRRCF